MQLRRPLAPLAPLAPRRAAAQPVEPRSYVRRQGQATKGQRRALRELWPLYGVDMPWNRTLGDDLGGELFGRSGAPVVLDVGCGHGDSLVGAAARRPAADFLGLEVHVPGLGSCVRKARDAGLANVKVCRCDVFDFLRDRVVGRGVFEEVCVFFPDPWFARPARRLIRPSLLDLLATAVVPGGAVRVATDVDAYADHARSVFAGDARWAPAPVAWRPSTQYERRGRARGHAVTDLAFTLR